MKKVFLALGVLVIVAIGIFSTVFLINYFQKKPGGILVLTNVKSQVVVDGRMVGKTPYEGNFSKETLNVRIVPEDTSLAPYEVNVKITPRVKTVINRDFTTSGEINPGEVMYFEKIESEEALLAVFSYPENSQVFINGIESGVTPFKTQTLAEGEYEVKILTVGYGERIMNIKLLKGYRLVIDSLLAKVEVKEEDVAGVQTEDKKYVTIKETPTGYLRVRTSPVNGDEIDEVKPGARYELLEIDVETGWYKILLEEIKPGLPNGRSGWISNEFSNTD